MKSTAIASALLALMLAFPAAGQVVRDGSVGPGGPGLVPGGTDDLGQPATYLIHDGLGEQAGSNLFHSFSQFDVGATETATFMSTSPTPIDLVLSRVTGGSQSEIYGTLRSTIPGADLYLMNPAGALFGQGSSLDVPGSLHVTTGDYLRHADAAGTRFPATAVSPTTLSTAPIEAFGFLDADVGEITVQDTRLELGAGDTLSLVGGDLEILRFPPGALPDFGATPLAPENSFTSALKVPGGRVNLAAVASPGEVLLDDSRADPRLDVDAFETLGRVRMAEQGSINVNGDPGGTVVIRGEEFVIEDDAPYVAFGPLGPRVRPRIAINSVTTGPADNPGVALDVDVRGDLTLENAQLGSGTTGSGRGGDVSVRASRVLASGPAFPVANLDTDIGIGASTTGPGVGGDVTIDADSIELRDAFLTASTIGAGPGGVLEITADELRSAVGGGTRTATLGAGDAGQLFIDARLLEVLEGGEISAMVLGSGAAGDIRIHAPSILISGVDPRADPLMPGDQSKIESVTFGSGQAGNVEIVAEELTILNGGEGDAVTLGPAGGAGGTSR
jgi:filamentous hemagglutinin family protein